MRGKKVKELRKALNENQTEILILLRNMFGKRTEEMNERQIYQNTKKLYYRQRTNLIANWVRKIKRKGEVY
jgi:hypothetical protein